MSQTLSARLNVGVAQIVQPGTSSGLVPSTGLPGQTNGVAIPAGTVGEKITFTSAAETPSTAGTWFANATPLGTLTTGIWMIYPYAASNSGATYSVAGIGTTSSGSTGQLGGVWLPSTGTPNGQIAFQPIYYTATGATPLYTQAYCSGTTTQVTVGGFAVRIA